MLELGVGDITTWGKEFDAVVLDYKDSGNKSGNLLYLMDRVTGESLDTMVLMPGKALEIQTYVKVNLTKVLKGTGEYGEQGYVSYAGEIDPILANIYKGISLEEESKFDIFLEENREIFEG